VFSTGIAMTHKPAAPRPGGDNLILAVVCSFGHPNPPGSPRCRVCGQPVDNANPRLVHRPVLAQLVTAGGARVEVTDTVLIDPLQKPENMTILPVAGLLNGLGYVVIARLDRATTSISKSHQCGQLVCVIRQRGGGGLLPLLFDEHILISGQADFRAGTPAVNSGTEPEIWIH